MGKTNIEWASHSWNPYTWDCTRVSPGCKNCYMMAWAERLGKPLVGRPEWRGDKALKELRKFPAGAVIFVNSMSDTYHESVPGAWIQRIHNLAAYVRPDVTFLLLTKRPERALHMSRLLAWPDNLWIGTSVESQDYLWRLDYLLRIPAAGHFLSAEPLLGPLPDLKPYIYRTFMLNTAEHGRIQARISLKRRLGWVIVGGESGKGRRPFDKAWAAEIRDMCVGAGTPFLFKQGAAFAPGQDRMLDGRTWDETPFAPAPEPQIELQRRLI